MTATTEAPPFLHRESLVMVQAFEAVRQITVDGITLSTFVITWSAQPESHDAP